MTARVPFPYVFPCFAFASHEILTLAFLADLFCFQLHTGRTSRSGRDSAIPKSILQHLVKPGHAGL